MHRILINIFGLLWIAFWVYWIIEARKARPSLANRRRRTLAPRIVIIVVFLIILGNFSKKGSNFNFSSFYVHGAPFQALGFIVFIIGLALAVWARIYIGRNWGMPMSTKAEPQLVTTGPYKYIRHPIYTGLILASIATAFTISWYMLVVSLIFLLYFGYSARQEEKYLTNEFLKQYPSYIKQTKMLIPFIY